ncbi:MAG: hypothetical protein GY715_12855 [Planctomycetes bacterium]|nr:hypothetical protein [Planctomycetota bacterium]
MLLNRGDGLFHAQVVYSMGLTRRLRLGDLDGDGDLDILAASPAPPGLIHVRLNDGNGAFDNLVSSPCSTAYLFDIGDLDGDGDLDFAGTRPSEDRISVCMNAGDGTFVFHSDVATSVQPTDVAIADVDGDEDADLLAVHLVIHRLTVWLNDGESFGLGGEYDGDLDHPLYLMVADLDGDGDQDAVATNSLNPYGRRMFWNQGDGSFVHQSSYPTPSGIASIAPADLDADGDLDLVMARRDIDVAWNLDGSSFTTNVAQGTGGHQHAVSVDDFDGDGRLEVAAMASGGRVALFEVAADGSLVVNRQYPTDSSPRDVDAGDMNNDGLLDLVTTSWSPRRVSVLLNTGEPGFAEPITRDTGPNSWCSTVGDFDGDGHLDVAVATAHVEILLGRGDGMLSDPIEYDTGHRPLDIVSRDFDGDGDLDLACAMQYGNAVSILFNDGGGGFGTRVDMPVGDWPRSLTSFDADGDSDHDILVASSTYQYLRVLINAGDGTFSLLPPMNVAPDLPEHPCTADLDGDGIEDVVTVRRQNPASILVRRGLGGGFFSDPVVYPVGPDFGRAHALAIGDIDGDGDLDAAVSEGTGLQIRVLHGFGNGEFGTGHGYVTGGGGSVVLADLDGNGGLDFAVAQGGNGHVIVGMNQCPSVVCFGDVDGSGSVDFADVLRLIGAWGPCPGTCHADLNDSGEVDGGDLVMLLAAWGTCK